MVQIASVTDIGVRRKENQDNFWVASAEVGGQEGVFACVCDGMGGLDDGGFASSTVLRAVRGVCSSGVGPGGMGETELKEALFRANRDVYRAGIQRGTKMGTTMTLLVAFEGAWKVYHVGDSRCYKVTDEGQLCVTKDHTLLNKWESEGRTPSPSQRLKYQSTLTRCLGVKTDLKLDIIEGTYNEGDRFLIGSDGFWHNLEFPVKKDLRGHLTFEGDFLRDMVREAIRSGETDNITAVAVRL